MPSQSWISATAAQREELRALAGSADREEADRARAMLLSLDRWTSERIAAAFCVQADSVRHWRWIFGREGTAGLRARKAPGPAPVKAQAAVSVIEEVLAPAVSERPNWTLPRWSRRSNSELAGAASTGRPGCSAPVRRARRPRLRWI